MQKLFIEDLDLQGKKVLIRLDLNVPGDSDGNVTGDGRVWAALPTLRYSLDQGAALILCSHRGRPKGKVVENLSLRRVAKRLSELLKHDIRFVPGDPVLGREALAAVGSIKPGEIIFLENLRFDPREKKNDPAFAKQLAELADFYINDAFPVSHRCQASVCSVPSLITTAYGYQVKKEEEFLSRLLDDVERPYVGILGGAKVSTKLGVIRAFLERVDKLLIGGGLSYTFMAAMGRPIGKSIFESHYLTMARSFLEKYPDKIVLAVDNYVVKDIGPEYESKLVDRIPDGYESIDIGEKTKKLFAAEIAKAKTVFWNGPLGFFEDPRHAAGTRFVAREVAKVKERGGYSVIGGGDSAAAIAQAGLNYRLYSFISTGGGAALEFVQGEQLPGLEALTDKES